MRAIWDYADKSAGYLTKIETQGELNDAMREMDTRRRTLSEASEAGEGARAIQEEVERRVNDPDAYAGKGAGARVMHRIMTVTFLRHLASPAYTMFNLMQPVLLTKPGLNARHGYGRATTAMAAAYRDISAHKVLTSGVVDTVKAVTGKVPRNFLEDIISGNRVSAQEKAMLGRLRDDGTINLDNNLELAHLEGPGGSRIGSVIDTTLGYADNLARALPGAAEAINRTVSALAAYRLELHTNGGDHAAAEQYARDVVRKTQFDYSASNAAPMMNTTLGRGALQFKKFALGSYYLLGKNLGHAVKGGAPGRRGEAVRTLAYIMATHQLAAGTLGLPGMELVRWGMMALHGLGAAAGISVPNNKDFQRMVEDFYKSMLGDTVGSMAASGISRGLPGGWGFDSSSRIGLQDGLTHGEPLDDTKQGWAAYMWDTASGAGIGSVTDFANGLGDVAGGDYAKGFGKMLPLKWAADMTKAYSGYTRHGWTAQDAILQAAGLTSDRQKRISDAKGRKIDEAAQGSSEVSRLFRDYANARTPAEVRDARDAILQRNHGLKGPRTRSNSPISLGSAEKIRQQNIAAEREPAQ